MIAAYPLQWPEGWPRTPPYRRTHGKFSTRARSTPQEFSKRLTVMDGIERVLFELARLGIGRDDIVISTNIQTRLDGLPRSGQGEPDDVGVAVYWQTRKGTRRVIAIDQYHRVADNLAAIAATLDAIRAIERHGGAQILERAFTGFTALPAPGAKKEWHEVFGVAAHAPTDEVRARYRELRSLHHPDRPGGSHDRMAEINAAWAVFEKERGISA